MAPPWNRDWSVQKNRTGTHNWIVYDEHGNVVDEGVERTFAEAGSAARNAIDRMAAAA